MRHRKQGTWLLLGGLLLMAAALFLTCFNLWDEHRAEVQAAGVLEELRAEIPVPEERPEAEEPGEEVIPDYLLDPGREMPAVEIGGEDYIGMLEVPALGLELPMMGEWSYPRLRKAPCRYRGSAYQGELIIAAHNYRSHFGGLKSLAPGDEVRFTDMDGNVFRYTVAETEVLDGTAVEAMEAGDWDLTLFTCTPGGQTRVTVRCVLEQ